jgi:hypothetical protein
VIVTLGNPRDKFWGMILALAPEGLSMSGIELASFEDFVVMVKDGESFSPAVVFFPMHRIERIESRPSRRQFAFAFAALFRPRPASIPAVLLGSAEVSGTGRRSGGARVMLRILPGAKVARFGEFEITAAQE